VTELRSCREALGISQLKLARLSGVSRFKICLFELGDGSLTEGERRRIHDAMRAQAELQRQALADFATAEAEAAR
jgi:predicted transcriptional regulator